MGTRLLLQLQVFYPKLLTLYERSQGKTTAFPSCDSFLDEETLLLTFTCYVPNLTLESHSQSLVKKSWIVKTVLKSVLVHFRAEHPSVVLLTKGKLRGEI